MLQQNAGGRAESSGVDAVISAMVRLIRERALRPGDRLPSEAAFARELGVSRTLVREALRSLSAVRLVEMSAGKRAVVAKPAAAPIAMLVDHGLDTEEIGVRHVYDVRRCIEARIVALAAARRTEAQSAEIGRIADAMRAAANAPERLMERDLEFHAALARASGNPMFVLLIQAFEGVTRRTWPIGWRTRAEPAAREAMLEAHCEIARAIEASDPIAAARWMERHFDESVRALVRGGVF